MEKSRRDALRVVINAVRKEVEDSLARQMTVFGLNRDSAPIPREDLALPPDREPLYPRLLDAVKRHGRALGNAGIVTAAAVSRFVREAGGTWVNRLAALRAMEVRGLLVPPAAFISEEYGGTSPRASRLRDEAAGMAKPLSREQALRAGIEDACRELSENVGVLFDLTDEQSLLWPDIAALKNVLKLFSNDVTAADWSEPDVLGWVYQYYNAEANAELKKRKARTTGFKYTADDIPVANQFYTPHWVVRVLTDNSLGRLWLEGRDRAPQIEVLEEPAASENTDSKPKYRLDERREGIPHAANEPDAFREWLNEKPDPLKDVTVDRLCRFLVPLPSRPLPRPRKRAHDIRVIDLACGSGHFLLYGFDVLFAMYREDEPALDPRAIPALILENNLFGIDIDLRAAQLAAFSLYMKAREVLSSIDPAAPLELKRMNIVVADAHIGDDPRKAEFLERYKDNLEIRRLFEKILQALDHTNALGSLLKVRAEFDGLFGRVKDVGARRPRGRESAGSEQIQLFDLPPTISIKGHFEDYSGRQWTIDSLLEKLHQFEREIAPTQDVGARLFYSDLERSVGLLSLLSQQYDIVLMNPPYGDMPPEAKDYLAGNKKRHVQPHYPHTHSDLYAAFLEQGLDLLLPNGLLGALVPWTYFFLTSLQAIRTKMFLEAGRPELFQEYGYGVLDGATVGTVASVIRKAQGDSSPWIEDHPVVFNRLSYRAKDIEKYSSFVSSFPAVSSLGPSRERDWFVVRLGSLRQIPGMSYAYWSTDWLRRAFGRFPAFDIGTAHHIERRPREVIASVKCGMNTGDDDRLVRFFWETRPGSRGRDKDWARFSKGGERVWFRTRTDLVLWWKNNGEFFRDTPLPGTYVRGAADYFRPGVAWQYASATRLQRFGVLEDVVFSMGGPMVFPVSHDPKYLVGLANSSLGGFFMVSLTRERFWQVGYVASLPFAVDDKSHSEICRAVSKLVELRRREEDYGDETCEHFESPDLLQIWRARTSGDKGLIELEPLKTQYRIRSRVSKESERTLLRLIDEEVFRVFDVPDDDKAIVLQEQQLRASARDSYGEEDAQSESETEISRGTLHEDSAGSANTILMERSGGDTLAHSDSPDSRDLVSRWLSYYLKQTLEGDDDGIIPVSGTRTEPGLILRLRETMEQDLGKEAAASLEAQAPAYLGTKDLDEWLSVSREETVEVEGSKTKLPVGFFPWHVNLYRNRPIFWLLSSEGFEKGKVRFTFRVYLHYLKLSPDALPRILSHYLENTIAWVDDEWRDAGARAGRAEGKARAAANTEVDEWLRTLDALRNFDKAIREVISGPPMAENVPPSAKWFPRTIATVRGGQNVGHGYRPDVDFGVRVNIKPLAEKRLLPRIVLKKLGG